jgi:hypothetical protein
VGGSSLDGITAADLNGDGKVDLAVVDDGAYGVTALLNQGGGAFAEQVTYQYGNAAPMTVAAADIDLDSDVDLVTSNTGSLDGIWIGINDGAGGFPDVKRIQLDGSLFDAVAADLDDDGDHDIATVNLQYDEVSVFENITTPPLSRDCNGNARPDECDIASGRSEDCNLNGIPDSCDVARRDRDRDGIPDDCTQVPFHRGDSNGDGGLDIADGVNTLNYLFNGSANLACLDSSDHDNDGNIDISDPVATLIFLFAGGEPPALPGPPEFPCGLDPDPIGSRGDLGCLDYSGCEVGESD